MRIKDGVVPKEFQKEGIDFTFTHKYFVLADEMGLGKTFQAIYAAVLSGHQVFIGCPANLRHNWVKELHKFVEDFTYILINKKQDADKITFNEDFIIVSYDQVQNMPYSLEFCNFWIWDEAHAFKNPKSKRGKFILECLKSSTKPEYLMFLTGTPITNRAADFWTLLYMCSYGDADNGLDVQDYFPNHYKWCQYFCEVSQIEIRVKGRPKKVTNYGRLRKDRVVTLQKLMKGKVLRRRAKDVLDLDPLQFKDIQISDSINKKLMEAYENPEKVHSMEIKEQNAYFKTKSTMAYAKQLREEIDGPIIIFSEHIGSTEELFRKAKKAGFKAACITGNTSDSVKNKIVDRFLEGEIDLLAATIGTMSTGYTFNNCNHIIFNDYSYNPSDNKQASKRIHRIGQEKPCFIHRMLGDATDKRILELVENKQDDINTIFKEK
jgi:SNF2 family DNA or RNA helicase